LPTVDRAPETGFPSLEHKEGYLQIPNTIVWSLFPLLKLEERALYQELYMWTHGFGENPRIVSQKKLQARLGIDDKRLGRLLARLEAKGVIKLVDKRFGGGHAERGTLIDVRVPARPTTVGNSPTVGAQPTVGKLPRVG
jgi:hypothetical protein